MEGDFLSNVAYEKRKNGKEKIAYRFFGTPLAENKSAELTKNSPFQVSEESANIIQQLKERDISKRAAKALVSDYPIEQIRRQIEVFDWLMEKKNSLVKKNPASFLRKSIEEDYQLPKEYRSHRVREDRKIEEERMMSQKRAEEEEREREATRIRSYKESLSAEERAELRESVKAEFRAVQRGVYS